MPSSAHQKWPQSSRKWPFTTPWRNSPNKYTGPQDHWANSSGGSVSLPSCAVPQLCPSMVGGRAPSRFWEVPLTPAATTALAGGKRAHSWLGLPGRLGFPCPQPSPAGLLPGPPPADEPLCRAEPRVTGSHRGSACWDPERQAGSGSMGAGVRGTRPRPGHTSPPGAGPLRGQLGGSGLWQGRQSPQAQT